MQFKIRRLKISVVEMMIPHFPRAFFFVALIPCVSVIADEIESPIQQQPNVVYAEEHGVGLVMDIFAPTGDKNGLAIVDVISGAWDSSRGKMRDHERAQVFEIMCGRGYTVFAVRPGSLSRFSALEMVSHIEQAIVWVKQRAEEHGIAADRLGLMGASAGGHLASLVAVANESSDFKPDLSRASVKAVGVFFPPTDLIEFGGQQIDPASEAGFGALVRKLAFPDGLGELSEEQVRARVVEISPARRVTKNAPPFLLIHGTADKLVPLEQSQKMQQALQEKGVSVELFIKQGGGHPWPTLHEEVALLADWFDRQLGNRLAK